MNECAGVRHFESSADFVASGIPLCFCNVCHEAQRFRFIEWMASKF